MLKKEHTKLVSALTLNMYRAEFCSIKQVGLGKTGPALREGEEGVVERESDAARGDLLVINVNVAGKIEGIVFFLLLR